MGAERTLMASLHKRGSWAAWVANRVVLLYGISDRILSSPSRIAIFSYDGFVGLVSHSLLPYLRFLMCCSAAEIFAWPEDGTSMLPVVSCTTGQDEAFALSDVDDSVLRAGCAATRIEREQKNRQFRLSLQTCVKNI